MLEKLTNAVEQQHGDEQFVDRRWSNETMANGTGAFQIVDEREQLA
jgi:hypothetical protein